MASYTRSDASASRLSFKSKHERAGGEGYKHSDDILDQRSSFEYGIFGVLFTLSKERSDTRIRARWAILKTLLDGWQLYTCVINPERQGWSIDARGRAWSVVAVLNFTWLANLGYGAYLAVLYAMLALLAVNVIMCVWVAWCFKEHKFPVVWPIKVLRVFSSLFFQAFDVTSLNLLQLGFSCRFTGPVTPHLHFSLFPQYSCINSPHIAHAIVSALCLVLFVSIALLLNMAEVEVNPLSRRPLSLGHSGADVLSFALKVLLTLVNVFIGWRRAEASVYLALSLALAWLTLKWNSNLVAWMNYLKGGVSATTVWSSSTLMLLVFYSAGSDQDKRKEWADSVTVLMLAGLAPAFGVGALISWGVIRYKTMSALKALKNPDKLPVMDAFHSIDEPRDIEVASRCCRVWKNSATLDPDAVNNAHEIIKAGVKMFPSCAYMVLLHGNFMIDVLGICQSGSRRIEEARKLNPSLMCRFIMFVRQQQATQSAAGSSVNGSSRMDLLGYVEYQRKQRMVVRLHREALQAMCNFWKALDASNISFTHLSKALGKIESSVSQAQRAYQVVLGSYGNNPKLVYLYGKFLQTVKNDPWHAAAYISEAERLEELQASQTSGPLMPDGTPLSRMDDLATAVLVINSAGEVQMANKHAQVLFGYKRGALEGMPLSALLAPHFAQRLARRLESLAALHDSATADDPEDSAVRDDAAPRGELVVGLHCDRLAFTARLILHKAMGVGEDSTIVAIIQPVPPAKGTASLWVTQTGFITACDGSFAAHFGWKASEVNGINIQALVSCPVPRDCGASSSGSNRSDSGAPAPKGIGSAAGANALIARLVSQARPPPVAAAAAAGSHDKPMSRALPCLMPHKYTRAPVVCEITLASNGSSGDLSPVVYELWIRVASPQSLQLLVVHRKGHILHASPELASYLVRSSSAAKGPSSVPWGISSGGSPDWSDGEGGGAFMGLGAAAAGPTLDSLAGYTLMDLLSPAWRDLHSKVIRDMASTSGQQSSIVGQPPVCRQSALPGPILEMRSVGGKELYMRVGVATLEVQGEMVHVAHLERSSIDAAVAERRLRLRLLPDGLIAAVESGNPLQLFGLEATTLVGRGLWEILEGLPLVADDRRYTAEPHDVAMFIDRSQLYPGFSWRVQVASSPPPRRPVFSSEEHRQHYYQQQQQQQYNAAIIQVQVEPSSGGAGSGDLGAAPGMGTGGVFLDMWPVASVVGVLELDPYGRIRAVLEERTRPVGLLFGVPSQSLVGGMLGELVMLPNGLAKPEDLLVASALKKSSMKARAEASVKVGPVHVFRATHQDGSPLSLDLQVVGKPGLNESSIAILRVHPAAPALPSRLQRPASQQSPPPAAALTAAALPRRHALLVKVESSIQGVDMHAASSAAVPALAADEAATTSMGATDAPVPQPHTFHYSTPAAAAISRGLLQTQQQQDDSAAAAALSSRFGLEPSQATGPAVPSTPSSRSPAGVANLGSPTEPTLGVRASGFRSVPSEQSRSPADSAAATVQLAGRSKLAGMVKLLGEDKPTTRDDRGAGGFGAAACLRPSLGGNRQCSRAENGGRQQTSRSGDDDPATPPAGRRLEDRSVERPPPEVPGTVSTGYSPPMNTEAALLVHDLDSEAAFSGAADDEGDVVQETSIHKKPGGRISKWVESQGAFYQNSDPDARRVGLPLSAVDGGGQGQRASDDDGGLRGTVPAKDLLLTPLDGRGSDPLLVTAVISKRTRRVSSAADSADDENLLVMAGDDINDGDGGSDAGQSAISGAQSATGSEYTRGKRVRKLTKTMDSSEAKKVQRRLRIHGLLTVALLAAAHIVCFALTVMAIKSQRTAMLQLGRSSEVQLYMHRVMIGVRSLDNIATGKLRPNTYTPEDVPYFVQDIGHHAGEAMARLNDILSGHSGGSSRIIDLLYQSKKLVWDSNNASGSDVYTNVTILDFGVRFYAMAKDVEEHHASWVQSGTRIANTTPGQFLIKSGPDFFKEFRKVMDALLYNLVDSTRHVEEHQIIFLVVEGAALSFIAACYLAYLLRAVAAQRSKLYSTFLIIPLGLTRALASQSTSFILDGDGDSDSDEEDEQARHTSTAQLQIEADVPGSNSRDDHHQQKIRRRTKLQVQDAEPSSSALAASGVGAATDAWEGVSRAVTGRLQQGHRASATGAAAAMAADRRHARRSDEADRRNGCWGWMTVWHQRVWYGLVNRLRGRASIHPIPQQQSLTALGTTSQQMSPEHSNKRKLVLDSQDTTIMLLPFIAWSALVIIIYAIAVVKLKGIDAMVSLHSIANFMAARIARTVLYSQELLSVDDPSQLPAKRANLAAAIKLFRDIWVSLQLGADAHLSSGEDTERFPLVTQGLASSSPEILQMLYSTGECHRTGENLPCPSRLGDRFYKTVYTSLASIAQRHVISLTALATNTNMTPPGLQDDNFDFIYNVGYKDLLDGGLSIRKAHSDTIMSKLDVILLLHIALFLVFWIIFAGFLLLQLNPLLRRIAEERRRVAELMSQLPLELDVERLVARALGTTTSNAAGGKAGGGVAQSASGDGAIHPHSSMGDAGARNDVGGISKWKAIIRAGVSLNGKAPSTDGYRKKS